MVSEFAGVGDGKIRLDKSFGGPKPSRSSVATITSLETRIFDKGVGEDSDMRGLFPGGGVSRTGASTERDSSVLSSRSSKPDCTCEIGARSSTESCESFPFDDLCALAPRLRPDVLSVDMSSVWIVVNTAYSEGNSTSKKEIKSWLKARENFPAVEQVRHDEGSTLSMRPKRSFR